MKYSDIDGFSKYYVSEHGDVFACVVKVSDHTLTDITGII